MFQPTATKIKTVFVLLFALISSFARAGDWTSTGGEYFDDTYNPWFLQNVKKIHYCIRLDQTGGFSVAQHYVKRLIGESFDYWKAEFKAAGELYPNSSVQIATQEVVFQEVCDQNTDLEFRLGFSTLQPDEKKYLGDVKKYAGVMVRKEYSKELKGRGIIYIASDQGPHRYKGLNSRNGNPPAAIDQPWSHEGLFKRAVIHELGHVFGLPHIGKGVMAETYLDRILSRGQYHHYIHAHNVQSFFMSNQVSMDCNLTSEAKRFFGVQKFNCLHTMVDWNSMKIEMTASLFQYSPRYQVGTIENVSCDSRATRGRAAVMIRLPEGQKVLPKPREGNVVYGPMLVELGCEGEFTPSGVSVLSQPIPLFWNIGPDHQFITGTTRHGVQVVFSDRSGGGGGPFLAGSEDSSKTSRQVHDSDSGRF